MNKKINRREMLGGLGGVVFGSALGAEAVIAGEKQNQNEKITSCTFHYSILSNDCDRFFKRCILTQIFEGKPHTILKFYERRDRRLY